MSDCVVAAAQLSASPGDFQAALRAHVDAVRVAADHGAAAVVFPELSLTGYELETAPSSAWNVDDPCLAPLRDVTEEARITALVGAPVTVVDTLYLASLVFSPQGVTHYAKQCLGAFSADANPSGGRVPPPEASVFEPGTKDCVLEIGTETAAIAICADIGCEAHAERAAHTGAGLYFASMFVPVADVSREHERLATIASRHRMAVVMSNFVGPTGGLASGGRSAIWAENGEQIAQLGADAHACLIARRRAGAWSATAVPLTRR